MLCTLLATDDFTFKGSAPEATASEMRLCHQWYGPGPTQAVQNDCTR